MHEYSTGLCLFIQFHSIPVDRVWILCSVAVIVVLIFTFFLLKHAKNSTAQMVSNDQPFGTIFSLTATMVSSSVQYFIRTWFAGTTNILAETQTQRKSIYITVHLRDSLA